MNHVDVDAARALLTSSHPRALELLREAVEQKRDRELRRQAASALALILIAQPKRDAPKLTDLARLVLDVAREDASQQTGHNPRRRRVKGPR